MVNALGGQGGPVIDFDIRLTRVRFPVAPPALTKKSPAIAGLFFQDNHYRPRHPREYYHKITTNTKEPSNLRIEI